MKTATEIQPISQTATDDIAIRVSGLSKRYLIGGEKKGSLVETLSGMIGAKNSRKEEFWALQDINFEVKKGEVIGIIGKNGAGKSTLLKILSRITQPTTGKIEINGRVASLLEVGTGFHPELTGRENIYLNGTILGMSRQEVKANFEEIVEFSGVRKFIDTPVKHYSSGMYVRLAFAVAAHLEPEILIIDEVLAVGDAEFQKKCLGKMKEVAGEGRTVLFVSHNMGAVKSLCNRIVLIKQGEITKIGDTSSVIDEYLGNENKASRGTVLLNFENDGLTIHSISSVNLSRKDSMLFNTDELAIEIEYTNLCDSELYCTIQLNDIDGNALMTIRGGNITNSNNRETLRLTFPRGFFNEKEFVLNVLTTVNNVLHSRINDALVFKVNAGTKNIGEYMGTSRYPLVGQFKWSTHVE